MPAALRDVQRLVLKGYHAAAARHVGLSVRDASRARAFLGHLAEPGGAPGTLTTAQEWHGTDGVCLTAGITAPGLRALGVPETELATFPLEFRQGAAARASALGDVGPSRPGAWLPWLRGAAGGELHLLLSLLGSEAEIDAVVRQLRRQWAGGLRELGCVRAAALPLPEQDRPAPHATGPARPDDDPAPRALLVHFGYRDGFSQPTLEGLPQIGLADPLPDVPVGAVVLGHDLALTGRGGLAYRYPVPGSDRLGRNGSFAAFRVLEQDVHAFEQFLQQESSRTGASPELLAAKLCGRWRDGTPLTLRPTGADGPVETSRRNDFDYAGGGATEAQADPDGVRCPLGSHIRRMNPRSTPVAGSPVVGRHRRIVRRGMPYGPPYDPARGRDGVPRGLVGLFIGASLRDSFEFVLREWADDGAFSASLGRSQDPLLGAHDGPARAVFDVPGAEPLRLQGLPRFVTTRGCAYLFLPSATALRSLASTRPTNPAAAVPRAAAVRSASTRTSGRAPDPAEDAAWTQLLRDFALRRPALLRELLEDAPVLQTPTAVVVSRYDDVREVLERPDVFSVSRYDEAMRDVNGGARFVLGMDGEDFAHDRALLEGVVRSGDAERVRAQVRAEAPVLLADPGPVDVVRFAAALAVRVAGDRLGVRGRAAQTLVEQCHAVFVGIFAPVPDPVRRQRARAARELLRQHVSELVDRASTGTVTADDALGRLVAAAAAGRLTPARVADQLIGLLVGTVDNVVAGTCSAVDQLLGRPEVHALAERAADTDDDALERIVSEVLRFAPPAPLLVRCTTREHVLAGTGARVAAGRLVLAMTSAAMVDPLRYQDPYEVDPQRSPELSLQFGAGPHRCLGRSVGTAVVVEAVRVLLQAGVCAAPDPDPGLVRHGETPVRFRVQLGGAG